MKQDISRLVLGTAQLGMDYGIANTTGMPVYNTARSIVQQAWESGIREFDTAQTYGQSEKILGHCFADLNIAGKVKVTTKLTSDVDYSDRTTLDKTIKNSIKNLGVKSLYGIMLHRENDIDHWENRSGQNLIDSVKSGQVEYVGVSVYSPQKAIQALNMEGISMVQLPTNIIDRRFEMAGVFKLASKVGKTIYIRSIFLQGLLLMPSESLPKQMQFAAPVLSRLKQFAQDVDLNIKQLCQGYIKNAFPYSMLIFGAEKQCQVIENIEDWNMKWPSDLTQKIRKEFNDVNETILNPFLWPKRSPYPQ